jgi:hypothetical protein
MPKYLPVASPFGPLWLHRCAALDHGPEWARRERLFVDAGPEDSRLNFQGMHLPFHGHLFRETDGSFRFSERDRQKYSKALLDEIENLVNKREAISGRRELPSRNGGLCRA